MTTPHCVMVWGTSSGAGKSWIATALCRIAARRGINVAPFKAQNMSNNARLVPTPESGIGEIGSAQYFQALAAGMRANTDINPILLKPVHDTASQVVINGKVDRRLSTLPWRERSDELALAARAGFERLSHKHDLIIMEGAGSPAEINLSEHDYVNLGAARWAQSLGSLSSILVNDIDRGGAFAHILGTWLLLPDDLRASVSGYLLNRFRGDTRLLSPGPEQLAQLAKVSLAGVVPMLPNHGLPEEDGWFDNPHRPGHSHDEKKQRVAIIAYPRISNLDEFKALTPYAELTWARSAAQLEAADWIILPGSKQVSGDLAWLHERGLDAAIKRHAVQGKPILGICGGLQMLGARLEDPAAYDGQKGSWAGLGLLALNTLYGEQKQLLPSTIRFTAPQGHWRHLNSVRLPAYQIRHGHTTPLEGQKAIHPILHDADHQTIGWQQGNTLGIYAHGLFESANVIQALFNTKPISMTSVFDQLADHLESHTDSDWLNRLLNT